MLPALPPSFLAAARRHSPPFVARASRSSTHSPACSVAPRAVAEWQQSQASATVVQANRPPPRCAEAVGAPALAPPQRCVAFASHAPPARAFVTGRQTRRYGSSPTPAWARATMACAAPRRDFPVFLPHPRRLHPPPVHQPSSFPIPAHVGGGPRCRGGRTLPLQRGQRSSRRCGRSRDWNSAHTVSPNVTADICGLPTPNCGG